MTHTSGGHAGGDESLINMGNQPVLSSMTNAGLPGAIVDGDTIYVPVKRSTVISSGNLSPNNLSVMGADSNVALNPDGASNDREGLIDPNPGSAMSASEQGPMKTGEATVARANTVSNRIELA